MKTRCRILWTVLIVIAALLSHTVVMAATSETVSVEDVSVVSGGKSSFVIVTARNVSDSTASAVEAVQSAAKILVGATSREESKILMNETPYGEYAIRVINGKIVIAAWDDKSIAKACDAFAAYVKEQGKKGELTVSGDYSASAVAVKGFGVIPHYGTVKTKVQLYGMAAFFLAQSPAGYYGQQFGGGEVRDVSQLARQLVEYGIAVPFGRFAIYVQTFQQGRHNGVIAQTFVGRTQVLHCRLGQGHCGASSFLCPRTIVV